MTDTKCIVVDNGDSFSVVTFDTVTIQSRDPKWHALAYATVVAHPYCACCGGKLDLQVHHEEPFHIRPDLELDPENLIVLCRRDHLFVGHLGDWKSWNVSVRKDAARWLRKIVHRPLKPT